MKLRDLAIAILFFNRKPISRIRLAKSIYFIHKELVRRELMSIDDIEYVRMPLGPVPKEFANLPNIIPGIIIHHNDASKLIYEIEEFLIEGSDKITFSEEQLAAREYIEKAVSLLSTHSTSILVEASRDQSWKDHKNGESYFISTADLKNVFPFPPRIQINLRAKPKETPNEIGQLQAKLLRGMINDIVKESTDLEFPDEQKEALKDSPMTVSDLQKTLRIFKNIFPGSSKK